MEVQTMTPSSSYRLGCKSIGCFTWQLCWSCVFFFFHHSPTAQELFLPPCLLLQVFKSPLNTQKPYSSGMTEPPKTWFQFLRSWWGSSYYPISLFLYNFNSFGKKVCRWYLSVSSNLLNCQAKEVAESFVSVSLQRQKGCLVI